MIKKAIRTICKRVTATPYKNKSPYLKYIMIRNIKNIYMLFTGLGRSVLGETVPEVLSTEGGTQTDLGR